MGTGNGRDPVGSVNLNPRVCDGLKNGYFPDVDWELRQILLKQEVNQFRLRFGDKCFGERGGKYNKALSAKNS